MWEFENLPVHVSELPVPELTKPEMHEQVVAPELLVLPDGQAVQEDDPAVAL